MRVLCGILFNNCIQIGWIYRFWHLPSEVGGILRITQSSVHFSCLLLCSDLQKQWACYSVFPSSQLETLTFWMKLEISAFIPHIPVSTVLPVPASLCWGHTANRWRDLKKWATQWVSVYQSWFNLCNSPVSRENLYSRAERQVFHCPGSAFLLQREQICCWFWWEQALSCGSPRYPSASDCLKDGESRGDEDKWLKGSLG